MIRNILKKDLRRKRTMNLIVLLFIILSTVFLGSSINNLVITNSALDYFAKVSNLADYFLVTADAGEIGEWGEESIYVQDITKEDFIVVENGEIKIGSKDYEMKQTTAFAKAPEKYNYLFDENDSRLPALKDDEIALSYVQSIQNDLTVGDKITIKIGELEETFHIAYIMKDMVFGSEYMGLFRVIVSDSMFERLAEEKPAAWNLYSIVSDDQGELLKEFNQNNFQALFEFSRNTLEYT